MPSSRNPPAALTGVMIGAGYFSGHQLEAWSRIRNVRVTGITDLDRNKARARARQWRIPRVYATAREMLAAERPDFVDIVTPPASHFAMVRLAARHGAAVLCQKPLAPTLAAARRLVRFCTDRGVRMMVNENWRWQRWFREARALIERGEVGELINLRFHLRTFDGAGPRPYRNHPYFRTLRRFLLGETLVHFLDTFRYLGGEMESVYCVTRRLNPHIPGEDTVNLVCRFASGALGIIDANRTIPAPPQRKTFGTFLLEGTRSVVEVRESGRIRVTDARGRPRWHTYPIPRRGYFGDGTEIVVSHR